jgi:UDP-N-acetylglucosamine--N-acetylmuramyl-(pentapeptide) pyrophosphoryl-undecaprenol N-acetylglucosamine transferase
MTLAQGPEDPHAPPTWLFAGGGTGGHLTPGLAVAAALRRRNPACRILFVGTDRHVEGRLLAGTGYERISTPFRPPGDLARAPWRWLTTAWRAMREADRFFAAEGVSGVIGLGGYSCYPHVRSAARRGVPTLLLEQNAPPGRAVRWLARQVDLVCASFNETATLLPRGARCDVVGNPVRPEIAALASEPLPENLPAAEPFTLLVLGGSLGATPLNDAIRAILESGRWSNRPLRVIHQTGPTDVARVEWAYKRAGARLEISSTESVAGLAARVEPFFTDMPGLYRAADLVVSRAGATTLAELACAGLPAILVPYPQAAANHQSANANVWERHGAAVTVPQHDDPRQTGDRIASVVEELWRSPARLAALSHAARGLARPDAAERVADRLLELATRQPASRN